MSLLCYDISSSGITAALLNSDLDPIRLVETRWTPDPTLDLANVADHFKKLTRELALAAAADSRVDPIVAISIGSFLHSFLLIDASGKPLTKVFTWLDSQGEDGVEYVRSRLGDTFHARTGCRYHPMFPIFKLAVLHLSNDKLLPQAARIISIKSFFVHELTGVWVEDDGMASATGLFNVVDGRWDLELTNIAGVTEKQLPPVQDRAAVIGRVTADAAREFSLPDTAVVVNGSGDGFLANIGSECESPERISVTLGTSGVARQTLNHAVLNSSSGTFCYKAANRAYLLGCAGSNGGNILDWGRSIFGTLDGSGLVVDNIPIFIPLLNGERSPDWNPRLTGSWHGLTSKHTAADLGRSVLEGVVFNLAHFVEIVQNTSGSKASEIVLSGNGFRDALAAPLLATVIDAAVSAPSQTGLASLRGSAICASRALGLPVAPLERKVVSPLDDTKIRDRYRQYRSLRFPS
jgi:gluconokinase